MEEKTRFFVCFLFKKKMEIDIYFHLAVVIFIAINCHVSQSNADCCQ